METLEQQRVIPTTWLGMLVGFFLGYILVRFGGWSLVIVALFGLGGYWIMAYLRGDVDLSEGLSRLQRRGRG